VKRGATSSISASSGVGLVVAGTYYAIERGELIKHGFRREFVGGVTVDVDDALGVAPKRFSLYRWVQ
jgi:hypothetical protein